MTDAPLRLLVIGAHPDDCEVKAGGLTAIYRDLGHQVRFLSMTNGATGHHDIGGIELALRRRRESDAVSEAEGLEYEILDIHCGELEPSVANRKQLIREIRECEPDLVLTHRPWDYHPDHRYTGMLVQDASYILTVPNMVPLTPHLQRMPVIMYLYDNFAKPIPFQPDIVVDIDAVIDRKLHMLHCHTSQMYEWLPYNRNGLDKVPDDEASRREYLANERLPQFVEVAQRHRDRLVALYGVQKGNNTKYAEAFETCEYGAALTAEAKKRLFPFLPS
ncbi:MAG: PIG-L deacetylase family protein [Candidatus Latescibacterota bacterium]|nr:PIG-L deacetylase family protein [Candidatus Latescibacterota bacterium]